MPRQAGASVESSAPAEVEITDAMIEAGCRAFTEWDRSDDWRLENLVAAVYRQMKAQEPAYR